MWIYTFYVKLLIKVLPMSFSKWSAKYYYYCSYSYFTISLPLSEAYIPRNPKCIYIPRNTKGNIKAPISLV